MSTVYIDFRIEIPSEIIRLYHKFQTIKF